VATQLAFEFDRLNPRLAGVNAGIAFPRFVYELVEPDWPGLVLIEAAGKDGGIDLAASRADGRTVIECKYVGQDGFQAASARWREVAARLGEHLTESGGPSPGQSQYEPWYRQDPPITDYIFCVSSSLGNQNQRDLLHDEIRAFFSKLAEDRPHLSHLTQLRVELLDWRALHNRVRARPHVSYRWFPESRPMGAVPLDEPIGDGRFRSYLQSSELPYFSVEHFQAETAADLHTERDILGDLEAELAGVIISGRGGVGKTRLTLELGRLAEASGWTVLRALRSFDRSALLKLAEDATPEMRVLLLIDYIELHPDFEELAELIRDLNETYRLHLRYIANCRNTFYNRLTSLPGHRRIDLSPTTASAATAYNHYGSKTVRHILGHAGVEASPEAMRVCHDTPVLAVFLAYLSNTGRGVDLAELIQESNFGSWVAKRVEMTFQEPVQRRLAKVVALLPLALHASQAMSEPMTQLLDKLVADGWVERERSRVEDDQLSMAHDVLADQILISYARGVADTADLFVAEVLDAAIELASTDSALAALQRVASEAFGAVDWLVVVNKQIHVPDEQWIELAPALLRTTLLDADAQIELLALREREFQGIEHVIDVQNRIGWLARHVVHAEIQGRSFEHRPALERWAVAAASAATTINYSITWALRLAPEKAAKAALRWLDEHPLESQTHFVLVAWLESGLDPAEVKEHVSRWLNAFRGSTKLSFVVRAWLQAVGSTEGVEGVVNTWLKSYATTEAAQFVYAGWLDAGGSPDVVAKPIKAWITKHGTGLSAQFVYGAWLDAGGEPEFVQTETLAWLTQHAAAREASFIYRTWLDAGCDRASVAPHIQTWLKEHRAEPHAQFVYNSWLAARGERELVAAELREWLTEHATAPEAGYVYKAWLDAEGEPELVVAPIGVWLNEHGATSVASYVFRGWLGAGGDRDYVEPFIETWVKEHGTTLDAQFVYKSWLDSGGDKELVVRPIRAWLGKHAIATEAQFVYKSWLDAGGTLNYVSGPIQAWLSHFGADPDAQYVYKSWLDAGGGFAEIQEDMFDWVQSNRDREDAAYLLKHVTRHRDLPTQTIEDVLYWCTRFPANEDALWRFTSLGGNLVREGLGEPLLEAAQALFHELHADARGITREQITALTSFLVDSPDLIAAPHRDAVDELILAWLRHPASFGVVPKPHPTVQRVSYLRRILALAQDGHVDAASDGESLLRFSAWIDEWDSEWADRAKPEIHALHDLVQIAR
jgi:hypothetical protein